MVRIAPWLPRAGAALATAAFFLPQFRAGERVWSPFGLCRELGDLLPLSDYLYHVLWILSWLIVPLVLLAVRRDARGADGVLLVLLLGVSFSLSTLGSVLLTTVEAAGTPTGLSLALFAAPLVLSAVAVGRVLGGGERRVTGGIVRASLGLLLALHSVYVAGSWWAFFGAWPGTGPEGRTLPGAWLALVGALVLVGGEVHLLLRAPSPDPAPARSPA